MFARQLALTLMLVPSLALAQTRTRFASLNEALGAGAVLGGRNGPRSVNWIDGGRRFSFIATGAQGAEIRAMDPATGRDTLLFAATGMTFPDSGTPFRYQSFQWARDSRHLVFQTRFQPLYRNSGIADYVVYRLADRTLTMAARGARTAELSPDGALMGYEKGGDLYVFDMAAQRETRLTTGATDTIYKGHFDWVYEEEFGLTQAWSWSRDSRYIAYWEVNESREPIIEISDLSGRHPTVERIRIPQPGDSNPTVRIGVTDVRSGRQVWLDPGETGEFYIPRIYWTSAPDTLAMITLNRAQNTMKLWFFDVRSGGRRLVMSETSQTWLDVYDFFAGVLHLMTFPEGVREFLWLSDRDGFQHIYRYGYDGRVINQVTRGRWSVTRIEGTDVAARTIYYTGTEAAPTQRQLYSVRFDGSAPRRLTQTTGTHAIDMSPDTRFYIDRWSSVGQPRQVELWTTSAGGARLLRKLEENAQVTAWLATHEYAPTELFTFTTSDGVQIDGSLIKPFDYRPGRRYPVVFSVYGGPGSQQVYDAFGASGWNQWLAQNGYIVVGLNNRGSGNYGSAFMKIVYRDLGRWESNDFAEAARWLVRQGMADSARIAIMGTSYGGYSALSALARHPDVFRVGIANSPVTDWKLYDSIYTERYMGLLGDNTAAYDSASVLTRAGNIRGRVFLIHSLLDDNVHPNNTMQLMTALTNAGVDADMRIYPPGRHGAVYNAASRLTLSRAMDEYLARYLQQSPAQIP